MTKPKKNPTWFFLLIIVGAVALLAVILLGLGPNKNTNVVNEEATNNEEKESVEDVVQPDADENILDNPYMEDVSEFEPIDDRLYVAIEDDPVIAYVQTEGIITQEFENGGRVTSTTEDFEGIIRESLGVYFEEPVTIDGREGVFVRGRTAKDGTEVGAYLVKDNGYIYEINGDKAWLDSVKDKITFIETIN